MDISGIIDKLKNAINSGRPTLPELPAILMACSLAKRPGFSVNVSTANVISDLKRQGFPTERMPDGTPNMQNKFVYSIFKEIQRAKSEDEEIEVEIPIGGIMVQVAVPPGGGTGVGSNIMPVKGRGQSM